MSKKYKKQKDLFPINILLVSIMLIILAPTIPISIVMLSILYLLNIKPKYVNITGIILAAFIAIFKNDFIITFSKEMASVIKTSYQSIFYIDPFQTIRAYSSYSASSWFIICIISLLISGYFLSRISTKKKLSNAGIKALSESVDTMDKAIKSITNNNLSKSKSTLLGYNNHNEPVYCADNAKHIFVSGTTGSGKTVLLSNFIKSGMQKNYGMLIIDGKGDMGDDSILEICKSFSKQYHRQLYVISMNEPKTSDKYNPFINGNETMCKDMLVNMSDWSEEHYKSNAERYIQRLIKLLNLQGEKLSFQRIVKNMSKSKFEELSAYLTKNSLQSKNEHVENLELIKSSGKIAEDAAARFATIQESEIGEIFDENGIDIFSALNDGDIILFVLNPLVYPETSKVMGRLVLIDAKKAISKMFGKNQRSFFIFDEINVYASTVLIDLINKSRSAGVTCIPATQSLADLEAAAGEAFKQQIIENCNNYVVLRQNSYKSAEEWAKTLGTKETMQMTYQLSSTEATGLGTAKKVREFIVHPDEIKGQQTGRGIFLSRDTGKCERIKIIKPF